MRRAKLDRRIRAEDAREGPLGLFLMREFTKRKIQLRRERAAAQKTIDRSLNAGTQCLADSTC